MTRGLTRRRPGELPAEVTACGTGGVGKTRVATVDAHLGHIFGKLAVPSRAQLASWPRPVMPAGGAVGR
jgi:hypothetical protein